MDQESQGSIPARSSTQFRVVERRERGPQRGRWRGLSITVRKGAMGNAFRGLMGSKPRNLACSDDDALCLCPGDTLMMHERTSILGDVQSIQGPSLISFTHACPHQIIIGGFSSCNLLQSSSTSSVRCLPPLTHSTLREESRNWRTIGDVFPLDA